MLIAIMQIASMPSWRWRHCMPHHPGRKNQKNCHSFLMFCFAFDDVFWLFLGAVLCVDFFPLSLLARNLVSLSFYNFTTQESRGMVLKVVPFSRLTTIIGLYWEYFFPGLITGFTIPFWVTAISYRFAFLFPWYSGMGKSNNLHGWLRFLYVIFAFCSAFFLGALKGTTSLFIYFVKLDLGSL